MFKKITIILLGIYLAFVGATGLSSCNGPEEKYYTVTFELNGGVVDGKDLSTGLSIKENEVIVFSEYVPTKTDHSFDGWLSDSTLYSSSDSYTVTGDVTFSAQWTDLVAQALAQAKQEAKATLDGYVSASAYRPAQQEELAQAIANFKEAIDAATEVSGVEQALASAKTAIDAIKTDAELTEEEQIAALAQAKQEAKTTLDGYVNASAYRPAQQEELAQVIANFKEAIDAATEVSGVEQALASAKTAIDAIKTDAELTEEEQIAALAQAKQEAKTTLDGYVSASAYRPAQQEELAQAIANYKEAIDTATEVSGVEQALASAKTAIDAIKTDAELTEEEQIAALAQVKQEAITELENYVKLEDYEIAQQSEITQLIEEGKAAINEAVEVSLVEQALVAVKENIDKVETSEELAAKRPVITTSFEDGQVFTNTRATLDVVAKDHTGNKLSSSKVTVKVNGVEASVNWDDHIKTSYNFVFVEGENIIVITAVSGNYVATKTYTLICDLEKSATVTVAIEAFTIGIGYLVEPINFELNEENLSAMAAEYGYENSTTFNEVLSMAHILDYVLKINGYEMDYQGALESTYNGFYMSSVSGVDTSYLEVPEELYTKLEENGYYVEPFVYEDGVLCEFDVTWGSGWMYTINGVFPNVPFCDYVPQDGDVMRVQFTLAYGADIGDWGIMGEPFYETVDRETLTKLVAQAIEQGIDTTEAVEVLSTFGVTQYELDAAYANLENLMK